MKEELLMKITDPPMSGHVAKVNEHGLIMSLVHELEPKALEQIVEAVLKALKDMKKTTN